MSSLSTRVPVRVALPVARVAVRRVRDPCTVRTAAPVHRPPFGTESETPRPPPRAPARALRAPRGGHTHILYTRYSCVRDMQKMKERWRFQTK
jgi:hypothetical protein